MANRSYTYSSSEDDKESKQRHYDEKSDKEADEEKQEHETGEITMTLQQIKFFNAVV